MTDIYSLLRRGLMRLDPETAHRLTLAALKTGLGPRYSCENPALKTHVWGREFSNPLGLAAGFDKNAEAIEPLFRMGFGFVEIGTVTPLPQSGNPRPRVFRDEGNESVVNRLGFPGKGLAHVKKNLENFCAGNPQRRGILGVNIGINKETSSPADDYLRCLEALSPLADYIAVNVSSPNTAGLRELQGRNPLNNLLAELTVVRKSALLLLKIAPDLDETQKSDIAELALRHNIDGLIVSNTTISRPAALNAALQKESGGLSGRLLKDISTEAIRNFYRLTQGKIPIIGVGGISSAEDAYEKIRAGASLVQLYTGLIFQGPGLIARILENLPALLEKDGFSGIADAVGSSGQNTLKAVV